MTAPNEQVVIRSFQPTDANACFKIRAEAFMRIFYDELGPEAITAAVNAYMPADYVRMARDCPTFVSTLNSTVTGFCMLRFHSPAIAEIFLIYVSLTHLRRGLGREMIQFSENWIRENHPRVVEVFVDTVIPGYNAVFYEKLGYTAVGEHVYELPGMKVQATRLQKVLKQNHRT